MVVWVIWDSGSVNDLRLVVAEVAFAVRAVLLCQRGAKLLVEGGDYPFRNLPGGAVQIGEALADGAAREWHEETGLEAGELRLLALVENFFELKGRRWHELGFYYRVTAPQALPDGRFSLLDNAANYLDWVSPDAVNDKPIYPTSALEFMDVPDGEFRHIVNREGITLPGQDLRLDVHGVGFQLRVHLIYVQDGHLLTNTAPGSQFWFLPGGSVRLNEDTQTAALREFHEETGVNATGAQLVGMTEGFDRVNGRQQLGLCYRIATAEPLPKTSFAVQDTTNGLFEWIPLSAVDSLPVHPIGLTSMLDVPAGKIKHTVQLWDIHVDG